MKLSESESAAITEELEALYVRIFGAKPLHKTSLDITLHVFGDEGIVQLNSHVDDSAKGPLSDVTIWTKERFSCSQVFLRNADFEANRKYAYEVVAKACNAVSTRHEDWKYETMTYEEYMNAGDR